MEKDTAEVQMKSAPGFIEFSNGPSIVPCTKALDTTDIIDLFLEEAGASTTCKPLENVLQRFCQDVDIRKLLSSHFKPSETALIMDGSSRTGRWSLIPRQGPLHARELYELLRPRLLISAGDTSIAADDEHPGPGLPADGTDQSLILKGEANPIAQQNIIHIETFDKWFALAIMVTIPESLIRTMRHAFLRHLTSQAHIGITNPIGALKFEMAFHLPFHALRDHSQISHQSGKDVSFLAWESGKSLFMYPATYSCTVAGRGSSHWIAFFFTDTSFEGRGTAAESIAELYEETRMGMFVDPCTNGQCSMEMDKSDPWLWFLKVLEVRLCLVTDEWRLIIEQLKRSLQHHPKIQSVGIHASPFRLKGALRWIQRYSMLAADLSGDLMSMRYALDRFLARYLEDIEGRSDDLAREVSACIRSTIDELNGIHQSFQKVGNVAKEHATQLESSIGLLQQETLAQEQRGLAQEQRTLTQDQKLLAQDNKGISVVLLILCTPIVLTSGIYSMDEKVRKQTLPFLKASPLYFFATASIFAVILIAIGWQQGVIRPSRRWLRQKPCDLPASDLPCICRLRDDTEEHYDSMGYRTQRMLDFEHDFSRGTPYQMPPRRRRNGLDLPRRPPAVFTSGSE